MREDFINKIKSYIEEIFRYIPIFTLLFIFIASTKLYYFYKLFGINVLHYCNFQDLLNETYTVIYNTFQSIVLFGIFAIALIYYLFKAQFNNVIEKLLGFIGPQGILFLFIFIYKFPNILYSLFSLRTSLTILTIYKISIIVLSCIVLFVKIKEVKPRIIILILLLFSFYFLSIKSVSNSIAKDLMAGRGQINMQFNHDSTSYKTDKNLIFLGENSNFIFIYDRSDSCSLIFNKSDLRNLKFKLNQDEWEVNTNRIGRPKRIKSY